MALSYRRPRVHRSGIDVTRLGDTSSGGHGELTIIAAHFQSQPTSGQSPVPGDTARRTALPDRYFALQVAFSMEQKEGSMEPEGIHFAAGIVDLRLLGVQ